MSTAHEEAFAFGLLDDAITALFDATRDDDSDPNDVPVDAVLIVGVPAVGDDGARTCYVEVYPRAGSQPASTRALVAEAGKLLDRALDDGDDKP
ncbi:DUF7213 family protein [Mycolicibacterium psychrotolerans]|uniref:Uncharacterized protein n=1 Tax=Mycolicibacterium psychrotolerans TaxID=216929 RepID=A0A7I7MBU3_9MYCO|nr:hypothetical protein [Mycolicibacterium psychrotolerans]BBX69734.1 hypothetical protein MPSYJ_31950 [Mycolicibacterium psychrotolerans]